MSTKSIWNKRPWRDTEISKSKHKFEQNHCFQWHRLTSQLFPRRLQRMKWASVANEIVHPLLQLLEIPSQNSTDFLSRVISDMRSANYCNCVFRFPCIAPDASSAPTPNCCCAASLLLFFFRNSWNLRHTKRVLIMFEGLKNWKEKPCYSIYSQMPEKWGTASSCMMMGTCVEESSPQPDACHIAEKSAQDPKHSFIT